MPLCAGPEENAFGAGARWGDQENLWSFQGSSDRGYVVFRKILGKFVAKSKAL